MPMSRAAVLAVAVMALPATTLPRTAWACGDKASWGDRIGQIVDTFLGDPAAGVDIDMKHVLDKWRSMHPKPLETLSAEDARRQPSPIEAAAKEAQDCHIALDPTEIGVKDMTFVGPAGEPLKIRIYTPSDAVSATSGKPVPVVVFYHGGGFVLDNALGSQASARAIAGASGSIVVTPDYRLAPEHKFPAAQKDSLAAYKWVLANAASFGGDPTRVALAGEGAGGLLATDTAIAAQADKLQKAAALILIAPAAGIDLKTNSWMEDSAARPWNKKAVEWALGLYLPKPADKDDPKVDLVGKADVSGLPPTTIVTAEVDPLRSDGERFGGKLKRVTVPVHMRDYPGVTHDFFGMGGVVKKAAMAQAFVAEQLKAAFAPKADDALALEDLGIAPYPAAANPATVPSDISTPNIPSSQAMPDKKN